MRQTESKSRFSAGWICFLLAVLVAGIFAPVEPVHAQERRSFFERLFAPIRKAAPPPQQAEPRKQSTRPAKRKQVRRAPAAAPAPARAPQQPAGPEKLENARIILVVGDFTASGLAEGLTAAFSDAPGVRVVQRANGSSGMVRDDYHDWFEALPKLIEEVKPSIVVIMIGANDRQQIATEDGRLELRTEEWDKAYEERAARLAAIVSGHNLPLVWVGQPPYSSARMSSDMVAFNDVFRRVTEGVNGTFVDIWDGFVDEAGAYVTSGPDMNGQPARLRASDGINITHAGRRKIAFYAEKPLRRLLGDAAGPDITSLEPGAALKIEPEVASRVNRTPPIPLSAMELEDGGELLGAIFELPDPEPVDGDPNLIVNGIPALAPAGRADQFDRR